MSPVPARGQPGPSSEPGAGPFIAQYRLPFQLFDELIQGVEADLELLIYPDYETLDRYCYRVASVVGLLSIEIFGYRDPGCRAYADALGRRCSTRISW